MDKAEFKSCDLVKINFSNCVFNRLKNEKRIILHGENEGDFQGMANTYRQLKRNRMEARNWVDAGDAYQSEMVMTQKHLRTEIRNGKYTEILNWLIMGFYDRFSRYQQSMGRPLAWLAGLWILCPIVLFYSDYATYESVWIQSWTAFKTSFDAALPLAGSIKLKSYDRAVYFLLLFERIMTLVLLTFLILATRARLRQ